MARTKPHVLSTRVDTATRAHLFQYAAQLKLPVAAIIGGALDAIVAKDHSAAAILCGMSTSAAPGKIIAKVAALLGLAPDADAAAMKAAFEDLLAAMTPPTEIEAGDTGEAADPRPPAIAPAKLSKAEQAYCAREKITPAQFAVRKASAARRVRSVAAVTPKQARPALPLPMTAREKAEKAYCARERITAEQYTARLAAAVIRRK